MFQFQLPVIEQDKHNTIYSKHFGKEKNDATTMSLKVASVIVRCYHKIRRCLCRTR